MNMCVQALYPAFGLKSHFRGEGKYDNVYKRVGSRAELS